MTDQATQGEHMREYRRWLRGWEASHLYKVNDVQESLMWDAWGAALADQQAALGEALAALRWAHDRVHVPNDDGSRSCMTTCAGGNILARQRAAQPAEEEEIA